MDAITILDDVVDQLTDHFEKSESVNYLYKECKKIVEARLAEMAECDFGSLLTWLDEIKLTAFMITSTTMPSVRKHVMSIKMITANSRKRVGRLSK